MGGELLFALRLEGLYHFIESHTGRVAGRPKPPSAFGATETSKLRLLNPYQLPAHGAPLLTGQGPVRRQIVAAFMFATTLLYAEAFYRQQRKTVAQFGRNRKYARVMGAAYMRTVGWSVGHPT